MLLRSLFLLMFFCPLGIVFPSELPQVTHYSLNVHLFPKEERLEAQALLTITNNDSQPHAEIPFLLYRLLDVQSVTDEHGTPLRFEQKVVKMEDENTWQVNACSVSLPQPLQPGSSTRLRVHYSGSIYGYPEVMAYTRDKIGEKYSLFRPDVFAYPMVARPSYQSVRQAYKAIFTYTVKVTVPYGYTTVSGGILKETKTVGDSVIFMYESKVPTWRLDIAAAKFEILKDEAHKLFAYALPEDRQGAVSVLGGMKRAIEFYSKTFGEIKNYQGYTAIEIPEGWGSQAGDYYILQAGAAFKDTANISEVYHEIAHTWNVKAKPEVKRCRWFDEAFGSYFESLAVKEFDDEKAFLTDMERSRDSFIKRVNSNKKNADTPIAEYGKEELGSNSYTKGAWSLYVLHEIVGTEKFREIIRSLLSEYETKPADFKDFQVVAERVTKRSLKKYFDEWIYGIESSRLLMEKVSIAEIVKRYK